MAKLILMRHGQSVWNLLNLFTGWVDVPLSEKGIKEALEGGKLIADIPIDAIFTSTLVRAQMTAMLAMSEHKSGRVPVFVHQTGKLAEWSTHLAPSGHTIPVYASSEINERMYGDLQGLNKDETAKKYGAEQVKIWRRSYDVPPPNGESLEMTANRSIPYFQEEVVPLLREGQNVLISAHGNSLRSIVMVLDKLSRDEVLSLEIPTGKPLFYTYDNENFQKERVIQANA
jgi:2,3-bisphosphoglycerate-dependent phosphoglycerate mutase